LSAAAGGSGGVTGPGWVSVGSGSVGGGVGLTGAWGRRPVRSADSSLPGRGCPRPPLTSTGVPSFAAVPAPAGREVSCRWYAAIAAPSAPAPLSPPLSPHPSLPAHHSVSGGP